MCLFPINTLMSFRDSVYKAVSSIPRGRVSTYKAVAAAAGSPGAFRAVGTAMKENPFAPRVPCHRVVKSGGEIGGYARGTGKKIDLLRGEGVAVKNGEVLDFSKKFFQPKTTKIIRPGSSNSRR